MRAISSTRRKSRRGPKCTPYSLGDGENAHHTLPGELGLCVVDGSLAFTSVYRDLSSPHAPDFNEPDILTVPNKLSYEISKLAITQHKKDQLLWLVHDLSKTGAMTSEGAPVNIRFYRRRIGMRGKELIEILLDKDLLEKCANHAAGLRASRYRFCEEFSKDQKKRTTKLLTKRVIQRRSSQENYMRAQIEGAQLAQNILDDLYQIRPGPQFFPAFARLVVQMQNEDKSPHSILALRKSWMTGEIQMCIRDHRTTSHICRTPSNLRALLEVSGEPAVEIDLPNSHPALLCILFEPTLSARDSECEEHRRLVQLVQSGQFYEYFESCWHADREAFLAFGAPKRGKADKDHEHLRDHFLCLPSRKGVKLSWQLMINCRPSFHQTELGRRMKAEFPITFTRMIALKGSGKDALGRALRRNEAKLMAELASATEEPCATIYDGILSNTKGILEIMCEAPKITRKHLGFIHMPVRSC